MDAAVESLKEGKIKVPDEKSDVVCDLCQHPMVIKMGRFGRFLACSHYPECKNTKPLAAEAPGRCPTCGAKILKKKSRNGYAYFGCEKNPGCQFMSWDAPTGDDCADCGHTLFKKAGRGNTGKTFCINESCKNFLPADQRGYKKKTAGDANAADKKTVKKPAKKKTTKKPAAAKKTTKKKAPDVS